MVWDLTATGPRGSDGRPDRCGRARYFLETCAATGCGIRFS